MTRYSRRDALTTGLSALATLAVAPALLPKRALAAEPVLTIYGPPASPSLMLARLAQDEATPARLGRVEFRTWKTPDEMRAGMASGNMAITAVPSYTAANMYNRGLPVRMLSVLSWGLLYVVARDPNIRSLADLAGKKFAVALKNDMPDLLLRFLGPKNGLNIGENVDVQYVSNSIEAIQLLFAGRVDAALVSEPAATAAVVRGARDGLPIRRAIDIQQEWARVTGRSPRIPQVGLAVTAEVASKPEVLAALQQGLLSARQWIVDNPASAARMGAEHMGLMAPIVEKSIATSNLAATAAKEAREELEFFFSTLAADSPAIIGGKLPDGAFYLG